jgi:oxalate decarboxylase/phosphoglucose isomerase-like protein (cupin superfamily)
VTDKPSFPVAHELGESTPVESALYGSLRIVDTEQLNVVDAAEADEGVVGAAMLMPPGKTSKPRAR